MVYQPLYQPHATHTHSSKQGLPIDLRFFNIAHINGPKTTNKWIVIQIKTQISTKRYSQTQSNLKVSRAHTSYIKMSNIRVAIGRGRKVRKRVRNQDEAYIDVWKL